MLRDGIREGTSSQLNIEPDGKFQQADQHSIDCLQAATDQLVHIQYRGQGGEETWLLRPNCGNANETQVWEVTNSCQLTEAV